MSKPLKGWQYVLSSDNASGTSRRTRRGQSVVQTIVLKRESDGLEVQVGDTVLVQDKTKEVALVKDIKFGTGTKFIDIVVVWFRSSADVSAVDFELSPNELFITPVLGEVSEISIIEKVTVSSEKSMETPSTFICCRASNPEGTRFSEQFDWLELQKMLKTDGNAFIEYLRVQTLEPAYKPPKVKLEDGGQVFKPLEETSTKQVSDSEVSQKTEKASRKPAKRARSPSISSDSESELESESSYDSDEPSPSKAKITKKLPRKQTPVKQRKTAKQPTPSPNKATHDKYLSNVLSPLKKGFKIKPNVAAPSLASLSPSKPRQATPTSNAFTELKAKLHTSAKLNSLPGREDETYQLLDKISTAIETETGSCVYVSGTPGLGKTATIRVVMSQLRELADDGVFKPFDYLEINGLKLLSPNVAYETLWKRVGGFNVSASNAAILLEQHFSTKDDSRKPLVVLMDELDQIVTKNQNVMYNFFNWPTYANSKLVVVAVANTMDLPERVLSNKISSRLGLNRIQFIGYTFDQLGEIIKHRLEMITRTNRRKVVMDEDAIGFASRKVASVSGDARRALTICRRAVEIAEQEYKDDEELFHVRITHISTAISESVNSPMAQFLSSLPFCSKLLLHCVLVRKKRSGLAENSLGDIIDEMKTTLTMLTSKESSTALDGLDSKISLVDLLYGSNGKLNIRVSKFKQLVNELVENGILLQQNISGERYRMIHLNISEEELASSLSRDKEFSGR